MKNWILILCFCFIPIFPAKLTIHEPQLNYSLTDQNYEALNTTDNALEPNEIQLKTIYASLFEKMRIEMLKHISSTRSINSQDSEGNTLLHQVCSCWIEIDDGSRFEFLTQLINLGADINAVNNSGNTPLHIGLELNMAMVPLLMHLGAKTDIPNKQNKTVAEIVCDMAAKAQNRSLAYENSVKQIVQILEDRKIQKLI